jgi:hypothetical protein
MGTYVKGTKGFYQEQGQTYVQSRARVALDYVAKDARSAKVFAASETVNGIFYTANNGASGNACLILKVPAQKSADMSLIYQGGVQGSTLVLDKVVYYYNSADKTLRRTIQPGDAASFRKTATAAIIASNVADLKFKFRDHSGVESSIAGRVAAVDMTATLAQGTMGAAAGAVALSGVRLRNMRSGVITGTLKLAFVGVPGAVVEAVFKSESGAYQTGTVVSSATTALDGTFEISGLDPGTYSLQSAGRTLTPKDGFVVTGEDPCAVGTITVS